MRSDRGDAIRRAQADLDAIDGAIRHQREQHDPVYREKRRAYLRGEIDLLTLNSGETHRDWWERHTGRRA